MRLYFFVPKKEEQVFQEKFPGIEKELRRSGISIISSIKGREDEDLDIDLIREADEIGAMLLQKVDAMIIEISEFDPEISYLLAYAILQKKPTLCLHRRGVSPERTLKYLAIDKRPEFMKIKSYSYKNLEETLLKFVKGFSPDGTIEEHPKIKFTLRVTSEIDKYLHFKTHNTKKTKAEFLREEIKELMKKDKDWQRYIERGRE